MAKSLSSPPTAPPAFAFDLQGCIPGRHAGTTSPTSPSTSSTSTGHNTRNPAARAQSPPRPAHRQRRPRHPSASPSTFESDGPAIFHNACKMRAEGIVSKRCRRKILPRAAPPIGSSGKSPPRAGIRHRRLHSARRRPYRHARRRRATFSATTTGPAAPRNRPGLIYAGRVGTGFTQKTHTLLRDKLEPLAQSSTPFEKPPADSFSRQRLLGQAHPRSAGPLLHLDRRHASSARPPSSGLREDKPAARSRPRNRRPHPKVLAAHQSRLITPPTPTPSPRRPAPPNLQPPTCNLQLPSPHPPHPPHQNPRPRNPTHQASPRRLLLRRRHSHAP